ncbi:580_t:CDS:2, partial [Dentiscutata heterogama]
CEECYGNKKELCEHCGCSVCKCKGDRGYILLCNSPCGKNFHTRCLNPPLTRIPPGNYIKKYKAQQDISNSDNEDSQNVRKFSKKKTTKHNKKCEALSDPLEKSTSHNDSSIDDPIKNIPIVVIEEDEHFSNRQRIYETENVLVTQLDANK